MNSDATSIPTVVFWILGALTAVLPIRWSVVFYLLLVQIDLSALGNFSTTSLGLENAIKVIIIPTLLLFRIRNEFQFDSAARKFAGFWLLFAGYACLAVIWSPFRVSAIKMTGYLYAYSVLFVVFTVACRNKWFNVNTLLFVAWLSLIGAVVQTYILDNAFGSDEFQWRFTTFTGAQSFAPFLLCLIVLLLFRERHSISIFAAVLGASVGLLLTGSRSIFLGFIWVLLTYGVFSAVRSSKAIHFGTILKRALLIGAAMAGALLVVIDWLPENRLNEMVQAAVAKNATVEDVGTFGWRLIIYQKTFDELAHRGLGGLLAGSGTSSAATLVLDEGIFQENNVDPNRAIHDEFLRIVYEWGFLGLFAFLFFLARVLKLGVSMAVNGASPEGWAFLAISVPFLISLAVENVLADSGSPGGVGYNLVLASMMASYGLFPVKDPILAVQIVPGTVPSLPQSARILPGN